MKLSEDKALLIAVVTLALGVGGGGMAKLAGVPYVHVSFATLGLPVWFGYFIGTCETMGAVALFIRPLRALAAAGIFCIMLGACYFHVMHTPLYLGAPAFLFLLLSGFIFRRSRNDALKLGPQKMG